MQKAWMVALPLLVGAQEDFISHFEYGEMLYKNPRGIACAACHKHKGEGGMIVRYKDKQGRTHTLRAPDIRYLDFERFYKPFTPEGHKRKDIMPLYYLTRKEIRAIYDYLRTINQTSEGTP